MKDLKPLPPFPMLNKNKSDIESPYIGLHRTSERAGRRYTSKPKQDDERASSRGHAELSEKPLPPFPEKVVHSETELSSLIPSIYTAANIRSMTRGEKIALLNGLPSLHVLFKVSGRASFQTEYVSHQLHFIRNTLRRSDPEQWELREMGVSHTESGNPIRPGSEVYLKQLAFPCPENMVTWTPTTYLEHFAYEMFVCAQITGFILIKGRGAGLLDEEDMIALGECVTSRAESLHRALWRIWTFWWSFGFSKRRENDLIGQQQWLSGGHFRFGVDSTLSFGAFNSEVLDLPPASFGWGNRDGLSIADVGDMISIWKCLQTLLINHLRACPLPKDGPLLRDNIGTMS